MDNFSYLDMIDAEIDRMIEGFEPALAAFPATTPALSPALESLPHSGSVSAPFNEIQTGERYLLAQRVSFSGVASGALNFHSLTCLSPG